MPIKNPRGTLVASSKGDKVVFHEKGYTVTKRVSSYTPKPGGVKRLEKEVAEATYFKNGDYSGVKSGIRGKLIKNAFRKRNLIELTTKPLLHVTQDQLYSFGYKTQGE